jgi:molybdate transport system substrate-binding protein
MAARKPRRTARNNRSGRAGREPRYRIREEELPMDDVVRLLSTLALKGAVGSLTGPYQAAGGARIDADYAPTLALLERLRSGEAADVVILTREGLAGLAAQRTVVAESCVDLARSFVGIAVKAGAAYPDIATEPALRAALLAARAVAYSRLGASGIFFAQLIEQLGIAQEINARAVISPQGFTAERLLTGEAELAVQQISELKQVGGVEVVGPIPHQLQTPVVFSAGRLASSPWPVHADALLKYLASPAAAPALRESGLEP